MKSVASALPCGTFPTTASRTGQAPFSASGSPGMGLHRDRALSPDGSRHPPHPLGFVHLPLPPFPLSWAFPQALGYSRCSATMRVSPFRGSHRLTLALVRLEGTRWLGSLFTGGSQSGVSSPRSPQLRKDPSVCPIVPCVSLTSVGFMTTQLGFEQSSSCQRRPN